MAQGLSSDESNEIELVLASGSPRRIELLKNLGLTFQVVPSTIEETVPDNLSPAEIVTGLAVAKAEEVAQRLMASRALSNEMLILAGDTLVVLGSAILGKPSDKQDARKMLSQLSGCCHLVYTGVALIALPELRLTSGFEVSKVYIRKLSVEEIDYYVSTEEPMDKAGAYALQGIGAALVEKIDGCVTNIIGLPIPLTVRLLRQRHLKVLGSS